MWHSCSTPKHLADLRRTFCVLDALELRASVKTEWAMVIDDSLDICHSDPHFKAGHYLSFQRIVKEVLTRLNLGSCLVDNDGIYDTICCLY